MAVGYILQQAGFKIGLNPELDGERSVLLRFLNEAAEELYDQNDEDGSLREQLFRVDGDQQIALPAAVGPIRAMREYTTHVPWHPYNMRPRYNQFNWKDRWRGWRLKGKSPLFAPILNEAELVVTVPTVEDPPVVVSITGSTNDASGITDKFVMSSTSVTGTQSFLEQTIVSITKDRVNNYDATVLDTDGRQLSIVPNNMLKVRYRIVDVSLYPWSNTDFNAADHWMEVLYKEALPWFANDDDEFPIDGMDNILVNKILQLHAEEQGKGEEAAAYDAKATRSLARKQEDANRGAEEEAALTENSHDTLLPRNRPMGPARYTGQIYY